MKLHNKIEIADFLNTVNRTKNNVYLRSPEGDCYNLKSVMSQYIAIAALIKEHGDELELFCDETGVTKTMAVEKILHQYFEQ